MKFRIKVRVYGTRTYLVTVADRDALDVILDSGDDLAAHGPEFDDEVYDDDIVSIDAVVEPEAA
jgi:hypothetical protein